MRYARKNRASRGVSAALGDVIGLRKVRGQIQLVNPIPRTRKPTPRQAERRSKFREAAHYASNQISLAESEALYATGINRRKHTSYLVALSDYLNAPTVKMIDAQAYTGAIGETILVTASDDFMVTKVRIMIISAEGVLIEDGEAKPDAQKFDGWAYKAKAENPALTGTKVKAVAYDRPGNTGTAEVVL